MYVCIADLFLKRPSFGEGKLRVNFKNGRDAKIDFTFVARRDTFVRPRKKF